VPGAYLDGVPYADGFEENVAFFRLDYLDPDRVELGHCFGALHPLLWLAAGGRGPLPTVDPDAPFFVNANGAYAVLFKDEAFRDFEEAVTAHEGISQLAFVTDSEDAHAEMRSRLGTGRRTMMLYRDFLRHYRRRLRS
jgi:adenine-specific DNA-methyltransferase